MNKFIYILAVIFLPFMFVQNVSAQCNVQASICTPGVSNPFTFTATSGTYAANSFVNAGCLTGAAGSQNYAFIILYITQSGPLNILVNGNTNNGFLDVAVFNVPNGVAPCNATMNSANAIGCNYASNAGGCVQFGNAFGCNSSVTAPNVNAGDQIMIIVQDYNNANSTFTLQLGPPPGAQTGPPDGTGIPNNDNYCTDDPPFQLQAVDMGGTWTGPGTSPSGMFDPATAGVGTHTINYSIGTPPCDSQGQTTVTVVDCSVCNISSIDINTTPCNASGEFDITGQVVFGIPPATGTLIIEDCNGNSVSYNPPFNSPLNYTIPNVQNTNQMNCNVTARFSAETDCSITNSFSIPAITTTATQDCLTGEAFITVQGGLPATDGSSFTASNLTPANANFSNTTTNNGGTITVTGLNSGDVYSFSVVDNNGCPITVSGVYSGAEQASISYPRTTYCDSENNPSPTINGVAGGTFSSTPGLSINPTTGVIDLSNSTPGTYTITYQTPSPDCFATTTFDITIIAEPEVSIAGSNLSGCSPLNATLVNISGGSYVNCEWNLGNGQIINSCDSVNGLYTNPGCYDVTLTLTLNGGCVGTRNFPGFVCVFPDPVADFTANPNELNSMTPYSQMVNNSTGATSFEWDFGDGSTSTSSAPTHEFPGESGTYVVTLTAISPNGCTDQVSQTVVVEEEVIFYVPNSFTPDGDEFNPIFKPIFTSGFDVNDYHLIIFNRWGEIMFESYDADFGWDGTYGGKLMKEGTYIWRITYMLLNVDKREEVNGHVNLLR